MKDKLQSIAQELEKLRQEVATTLKTESENSVKTLQKLWEQKSQYIGKKSPLGNLLGEVGKLAEDARVEAGREINTLKKSFEETFNEVEEKIKNTFTTDDEERREVGLPGTPYSVGKGHPLAETRERILCYFNQLGFITMNGFELETDYYNFQALNMPEHHPARDSQDSFYLSPTWVLRTQTSPMQIRAMEMQRPPLAIISPGKVFRRDTIDATHSYCFHQVEGIFIDSEVGFSDLKGVLTQFCKDFFGEELRVRLRPDYFPFTEPSCEISIEYPGKKDGWLEILGAGMVNPLVLKNAGIDYTTYTGFAFGLGIERIAMLLHGISDIRLFFENDYRFLKQF